MTLLVVHAIHEDEPLIRLISARKVTPNERTTKMVVRIEADLRKPLTKRQKAELAALAAMPDSEINTVDIPELTREQWKNARPFHEIFKPRKEAISIRVDADILEWLKAGGEGWQTRINGILREQMQKQ